MGTIFVDTLEPQSGTTLTVGETGQNTVVGGNTIKLNTLKDAGGNTLFVSDGSGTLTSVNSSLGGTMVLIQSQSFTDQATVSFTSGITSSYGGYSFKFYDINPATDGTNLTFQANAVGGSGFNESVVTTYFVAYNNQANNSNGLTYQAGYDESGTAYILLNDGIGNGADESTAGELHLFNPSSTTYVKNFYSRFHNYGSTEYSTDSFVSGYFNITAAIDEISFKFSSGNFDGKIKMFGIK